MENQEIVKLVAFVAVEVVALLVCWLVALRTKKTKFKQLAKVIAIFGFAYIAMYGYVLYEKNAPRPDFVTDAVGPARGGGGVTREVFFPVLEGGDVHQIELTPQTDAEEVAKGKIDLYYKLESKLGKVLVEAVPQLEPADGRQWRTLAFPFTPEAAGEFILKLEIPAGVGSVHVVVKEPR